MKMWLVQRGEKKVNEFKGLFGKEGLVEQDYMGAAEFEWFAKPHSYTRIMGQYEDYVFHKTSMININGCPLWVFAHKDKVKEVEDAISAYIKGEYSLKEWTNLEQHFDKSADRSMLHNFYALRTDFWWDIKNDFFFFVGAADVKGQYEKAIKYDYTENWLTKSEKEREEALKEAYH